MMKSRLQKGSRLFCFLFTFNFFKNGAWHHLIKSFNALDMNSIQAPFLKNITVETPIELASQLIETISHHYIDCINWPDSFSNKPDVSFKIAVIADGLLVKFYVKEDYTRATFTIDNQEVYHDSCVELFIDPSRDGTYYNFEFNAIGTLLLGFGADRHDRPRAPQEITKQVKRHSSNGVIPFDNIRLDKPWDLTVIIPFSAFWHHSIISLDKKKIRANFQKCGEDLPVPHYLTWNPILTLKPDYHQPAFFGSIDFK